MKISLRLPRILWATALPVAFFSGFSLASAGVAELEVPASWVVLEGGPGKVENGNIESWESVDTRAFWTIETTRAGTLEATILAANDGHAGSEFDLYIGEERVSGKVPDTGGWQSYQPVELGRLSIPRPGTYSVAIIPRKMPGRAIMNLQEILLKGTCLEGAKVVSTILPVVERKAVPVRDLGIKHNTLTRAEKAQGWQLLFNGKDLTGWYRYRGQEPGSAWKAEDGTLHFAPGTGGGGDIISSQKFDNFELNLEWKIAPGGNSGIFYRASEERKNIYESAPEMQVLDNDGHRDGGNLKTSAGACYALYDTDPEAVKPVGEWNAVRIVAQGRRVQLYLNGRRTADYTVESADWLKRYEASKFRGWPSYGRMASGYIGLQDHGDRAWFRNIKIRPL